MRILIDSFFGLALLIPVLALGAAEPAGKVIVVRGKVERVGVDGRRMLLQESSAVFAKDTIETADNGSVKIMLQDGSELTLSAASKFRIDTIEKDEKPSFFTVLYGNLRAKVTKSTTGSEKMVVKTPNSVMGVRGTNFETVFNPANQMTSVVTYEGAVAMAKNPSPGMPVLAATEGSALATAAKMAQGAKPELGPQQARAISEIAQIAADGAMPKMAPADANAMVQAANAAKAAGGLSPVEAKAVADIQKIAAAAQNKPVQLTSAQMQAVVNFGEVAKDKLDPEKLPPAVATAVARTEKLAERIAAAPVPTPAQINALAVVQTVTTAAVQGRTVEMTPTQAKAMEEVQKLADVVADKVPDVKLPAQSAETMQQMQNIARNAETKGLDLSPQQRSAVAEVQKLANTIGQAGKPVELTPLQARAMQEVQKLASDNIEKGGLQASLPPDQAKLVVARVAAIAQVGTQAAQAPPAPPAETMKVLANIEKTMVVSQGQFSSVAAAAAIPIVPVKISPTHIESMKQAHDAGPASTDTGRVASTTTGTKIISPVPPGLDGRIVAGGANEVREAMNKTLAAVGADSTGAPGAPANALAAAPVQVAPPEGFYDAKTGRMAPPSGGLVDLKTGLYVPPPPGSAFDPVANVYVPPPTLGSFNVATGNYVPPAGFALDSVRGFVQARCTARDGVLGQSAAVLRKGL